MYTVSRDLVMAGPLSFTYEKVGVLMEAYSGCGGWWWFDEVGVGG